MSSAGDRLVGGRYRLAEALGRGGMGAVWRARDEVLARDVAVKELVFPPGMTRQDQQVMRGRMMREARTAARLSHPGVVRIFDVVEDEERPWIVMELLPSARSLSEILADEGALGPHRAAKIGLDVLAGLAAAHAAGVLHRDVKPGNILIATDGRAVLGDFGIAVAEEEPTLTRSGVLIGSPAYLSPEQARGKDLTPASDLWSLGATLYTVVEGRTPFHRDNVMATLTAIIVDPPDPPRRAGPLRPVIEGLLRKNPADRLDTPTVAARLVEVTAEPEAETSPPAPATTAESEPAQRTAVLHKAPGGFAAEHDAAPAVVPPPAAAPSEAEPPSDARPPTTSGSAEADGEPVPAAEPKHERPPAAGAKNEPTSAAEPPAANDAGPEDEPPPAAGTEDEPLPGAEPPATDDAGPEQEPVPTAEPEHEPTSVPEPPATDDAGPEDEPASAAEPPAADGAAPWAAAPDEAGAAGASARTGDDDGDDVPGADDDTSGPGRTAAAGSTGDTADEPREVTPPSGRPPRPRDPVDGPRSPSRPPRQSTAHPSRPPRRADGGAAPSGAAGTEAAQAGDPADGAVAAADRAQAGTGGAPARPRTAATEPPARAAAPATGGPADHPYQPPSGPARGGTRRRRLVAGVAALVVAGGGVTLALDLLRTHETHRATTTGGTPRTGGASRGPAVAGSGRARTPAATSSSPATAASHATTTPAGPGSGAVPAGFRPYHDPTGFSIDVPDGWRISHDGGYVYVRDPGGGRYLLVDQTTDPKPDPLADWRDQDAYRRRSDPGYHRIALRSVPGYFEKAADLEFTHGSAGDRTHVLNRNILVNGHRAYALYWSTPEAEWQAGRRYFDVFAGSFRPAS